MRFVLLVVLGLVLASVPAAALPPTSTVLTPLTVSATTGEKPQSKAWTYAGRWWCVLPTSGGTYVWRLDGTQWTSVLQLSGSTSVHADVQPDGALCHVLLFDGASSQLASIEYVPASQSYQRWSTRPANVALPLDGGTETATLARDTQGRLWLASDHAAGADQIVVYWSDAPYGSWSGPVSLASGIDADDIAVVTVLGGNRIGVLWSNQVSRRFGFRVHVDGAATGDWSADEVPASQSALAVGAGMADDHLHVALASDGTLYAAVKTSYDTVGYPKIALLVRRPGGTWDGLYAVDEAGTRPLVLLDEAAGRVTVVYTTSEGSGSIVARESSTGTIAFGASAPLMPGGLNDATSMKGNLAGAVVVLAGDGSRVDGVLRSGGGYTIAASAGSGGTISPVGSVSVSAGSNQSFIISANTGHTIADVLVDGLSVGAVGSYTFSNVTADHTIAASFTADGGPTGSIGWWKLDGDVTDASGNGFNATAVGSPGYVAGASGQALDLNGTSQYAYVPDAPALRPATNAITLATWIRPTQEATQNLVSKSTNGGIGGYELCLASTGSTWPHKAFFRLNQVPSGDTYRINSTTLYSDHLNTWIHLAATYDGATMRLYVNGVLESSLAASVAINPNTLPLGIGAEVNATDTGTRDFKGAMDDVRVYDRALSAGEIAALANLTTYTITASAGTGGTITPNGAVVVSAGASQAFTIASSGGYHVADVLVDGGSVGAVGTYTFTDVQAPHTIAAQFAPDLATFTLTASAGANGTISPSGAVSVLQGASQTFTIGANGGYHVADVLVDGGSVGAVGTYTFTNVQADHTIAARFAADVPAGGLVGRWPMEEGSGSAVADVSGHGLNGTAIGGPAWVAGVEGAHALAFTNGTSQYVAVPDAAALGITDAITLAAWIKPYGPGSWTASVLDKATFASSPKVFGYELNLSTTGVPFCRFFDDAGGRLNAVTHYPTDGNTWMHVAATYDGATIRLYVNGALDASKAATGAIPVNTLPLAIGAPSDGLAARVFPGAIDDARVYDRALTASEIAALASVTVTHTLTASAGAGGTISPSGAVVVADGASQAFAITPAACHDIADVQVDGASVGAVAAYTFTHVTADHTIAATFAPRSYTITATADAGGSISPSGAVAVGCGASQAYTIAPAACYDIADVRVDGVSVGAVGTYTFTDVQAAHTIAATFALRSYTITASAGAGGSINPSGAVAVGCGASQAFALSADGGFHVADVLVDGGSVGAVTSYTFTNVQAAHTLAARFTADVATDLLAWWPFEEGSGTTMVDASGHGHDGALANGASWVTGVQGLALSLNGSNQRGSVPDSPDLRVTNAFTLATWVRPQRVATQHLLHKGNNDTAGGYELSLGSPGRPFVRFNQPTNGNLYRLDGTQAYPADGTTWVHLAATYDGATLRLYVNGALDSSKAASATIATSSQPLAIGSQSDGQYLLQGAMDDARVYGRALSAAEIAALHAHAPLTHVITATAGADGTISPSGAVTVDDGASQTFTFTPAAHHHVATLTVDGGAVAPALSYTFTDVTADHTIGVTFAIDTFTLAYTAGPGGTLSGSTPQAVPYGGSGTQVIAVPDAGHHFVSWSDGRLIAARTDVDVTADLSVTASFAITTHTLTATAEAHGSISPNGAVVVNEGASQAFTIGADTGYQVADVRVDGGSVGAVTTYTFTNVTGDHTIAASFAPVTAAVVAAQPAAGATITRDHPCVTVPVTIARSDLAPLRGYSVTLRLSPELTTCGAGLVSAGYPLEPRSFEVTARDSNRWVIDEVTLGSPCGVTGSGTLFTVDVTAPGADGSGTITVESVMARDCLNQPIAVVPGAPATLPIRRNGPARTVDLTAVQVTTGNHLPPPMARATTPIALQFTLPPDAAGVEVYRRPFGGYPQYDEAGGGDPSLPAYPPGAGWTLTAVTAPGQTDEPPTRDVWYYVLVSKDAYGNLSPVSNLTTGTLDYDLGDVSDGVTACAGDDQVTTADVSLLGSHYGATLPVAAALECLDVGPTADYSVNTRPRTDNRVDFEDLMMFALNYGTVSAPPAMARPARAGAAAAGDEQLALWAPPQVTAGETFPVILALSGAGVLQGISARLAWDAAVAEPLSVTSNGLFEGQSGVLYPIGLGTVDAALLGLRPTGLSAGGAFATFQFRALRAGDPRVAVADIKARDRQNHPLVVQVVSALAVDPLPVRTQLSRAMPTPFATTTALEFGLATAGPIELGVFGVDGRRVRTLAAGEFAAGDHRVEWDGRDDGGRRLPAGVYFARLIAGGERLTRTLVRLAQ